MALDGHGILCEDGGSVLTGSDAPVLRQNMRPAPLPPRVGDAWATVAPWTCT